MKKIILIIPTLLITTFTFAQKIKDNDVPSEVRLSFQKLHPNIKDVDWEKEDANFEAEFEAGKTETSVVFDSKGNILETETEIASSELPATIANYISTNYPGQNIKEAAKIVTANGTVMYEAEIKDKDLIFDSNGSLVKEVKK